MFQKRIAAAGGLVILWCPAKEKLSFLPPHPHKKPLSHLQSSTLEAIRKFPVYRYGYDYEPEVA